MTDSPVTFPERRDFLIAQHKFPVEKAIRHAYGDSIVGLWYCPVDPAHKTLYPNPIRAQYGLEWDGKCPCGKLMQYDEEA